MTVILLVWLLGIVMSSVVGANNRNRPVLGALVGAMFGPLFGPLLALGLSDGRLRCLACRTVVHHEATICPACRSSLVEPEPAVLPMAPMESIDPRRGWG